MTQSPLTPITGRTHGGQPLSLHTAPSADLAPYIARIFVTIIDQPAEHTTTDFLLNDTPFIRLLPRGYWEGEVAPGVWRHYACPLLFGAQSKPLRIRVRGPMATLGCAIRPAGYLALFDQPASCHADALAPLSEIWSGPGEEIADAGALCDQPARAIAVIEDGLRRRLAARPHRQIDTRMDAFERIAWSDPAMPVGQIADRLHLSARQFQDRTLCHFGHPPKTVLSRSRFLNFAATVRGIVMPSQEELAALHYFDQSHVTREVRRFTGMTPVRFLRTSTPILTLGIEARQARRAEEEALLGAGTAPPWRAPASAPLLG